MDNRSIHFRFTSGRWVWKSLLATGSNGQRLLTNGRLTSTYYIHLKTPHMMQGTKLYDKTIFVNGSYLRIGVNSREMTISYNENVVATSDFKEFTPFTHILYVEENGKAVTYDITLLISSYVRCLVGKDGWLIYSDDPAIRISGVDNVTNHLQV